MKKRLFIFSLFMTIAFLFMACGNETPPKEEPKEPEDKIMSVSEVIATPDLTEVEFVGYVIGFDLGVRHVIIEDKDGSSAIQMFKSTGFPALRVGDEVQVGGIRTFDRSTDRIAPDYVEILSRDNSTSADNPIVIKGEDLFTWTSENRMNADILFRFYRFEDVIITSVASNYSFIDDQYDEEGGRGIKIGIHSGSVFPAANFQAGKRYTFSAILFGPSDDFFDETRDGIVLRLSVLKESDVTLLDEETDPTEPENDILTVTEVIEAEIGTSFKVEGVVIGYGDNGNFRTAIVIEDPANGNAVEMWANNNADFKDVEVGDLLVVSGTRAVEKGYPRINSLVLIEIKSSGNALTEPTIIEDVPTWLAGLLEDNSNFLGRYTATVTVVEANNNYAFFNVGEKELQFAIHQAQSIYKHDWEVGKTYTVTLAIVGISDKWEDLASKSITIRGVISSASDIVLVE